MNAWTKGFSMKERNTATAGRILRSRMKLRFIVKQFLQLKSLEDYCARSFEETRRPLVSLVTSLNKTCHPNP